MQIRITFEEFSEVFDDNILRRSRSARGISQAGLEDKNTEIYHKKKKSCLSGGELARQVALNTACLIRTVWGHRVYILPDAERLRYLVEIDFDIVNNQLEASDTYTKEYENLKIEAQKRSKADGITYRINPRYRLWEAVYGSISIQPILLELAMDEFYRDLADAIGQVHVGRMSQAELLAFADLTLDQEIHPWRDGCGRVSTALVMWLSVILADGRLPVFASKEEHYASMKEGLAAHTKYYERCLGLA